MKALILAGGRGTRLRPLTHTQNKHLLPIANEPMISRIIGDAVALGINEIIINLNQGDKEVPTVLGNGKKFSSKTKISYIEQPTPNGMMWPIKLAEKIIGKDEFLFAGGDNILVGGLKQHYKDFKSKKSDAHVLVVKRPDYQNFGVAVMNGDRVVRTVEKPKRFVSDLVLTAIYFFTPVVFECMDKVKPIDPKGTGKPEYYPPVVINWLIKHKYKFTASEITGWWKDTGMPEDIIAANAFVLRSTPPAYSQAKFTNSIIEGPAQIDKTAKIKNSTVRGPVCIGKHVVIENCYIGPYTSIGDGCNLINTELENSIIMEESSISNVTRRLDGCLIGKNVTITENNHIPKSSRLYVGDDSTVNF